MKVSLFVVLCLFSLSSFSAPVNYLEEYIDIYDDMEVKEFCKNSCRIKSSGDSELMRVCVVTCVKEVENLTSPDREYDKNAGAFVAGAVGGYLIGKVLERTVGPSIDRAIDRAKAFVSRPSGPGPSGGNRGGDGRSRRGRDF